MAKSRKPSHKNTTEESRGGKSALTDPNSLSHSENFSFWNSSRWASVFLALFTIVIYANSLSNGYNLDDDLVTQGHHNTSKGLSALEDIFTSPYYSDPAGNVFGYRPMVHASFALEHQFFGENPQVSHSINLLLYTCLVLLLFHSLKRLLKSYSWKLAFAVAILFAVHPIHTEVVDSIKNRDEILGLLFAVIALYGSITFVDQKNILWMLGASVSLIIGLLAKSSVLPFAFIIPLSVYLFRKISWQRFLWILMPMSSILAFYFPHPSLWIKIAFFFSLIMGGSLIVSYESTAFKAGLNYFRESLLKVFQFLKSKLRPFAATAMLMGSFFILARYTQGNVNAWWSLGGWFLLPLSYLTAPASRRPLVAYMSSIWILLAVAVFDAGPMLNKSIAGALMILPVLYLREQKLPIWTIIFPLGIFAYHVADLGLNNLGNTLPTILFIAAIKLEDRPNGRKLSIGLLLLCAIFLALFNPVYLLYMAIIPLVLWVKLPLNLNTWTSLVFIGIISLVMGMGLVHFGQEVSPLNPNPQISQSPVFSPEAFAPLLPDTNASLQVDRTQDIPKGLPFGTPGIFSLKNPLVYTTGRPLDYSENPLATEANLSLNFGTSMMALGYYFRLLIYPYPLRYYYGYDMVPIIEASDPFALAILIFHLGLLIIAFWAVSKLPPLALGLFWYLSSIFIFSNLMVPVAGILGERLAFTASAGFCLALISVGHNFFPSLFTNRITLKTLRKPQVIVLLLILGGMSVMVISRNKAWKDQMTLFRTDIVHQESCVKAYHLLGIHLSLEAAKEVRQDRQYALKEEAAICLEKAHAIYPEFPYIWYDLGEVYLSQGKKEKALQAFQKSVLRDTLYADVPFKVATLSEEFGDLETAITNYHLTISIDSAFEQAYSNLCYVYFLTERIDQAIEIGELSYDLFPESPVPAINLGKIMLQMQDTVNALPYLIKAYELGIQDPNLVLEIADCYEATGYPDKAKTYRSLLTKP